MRINSWAILSFLLSFTAFGQANFSEVNLGLTVPIAERGRGISIADYDNDGDDDLLFLGTPSKLLRNDGELTFTEVTSSAGLSDIISKMAIWFDINNDGWLDVVFASWDMALYYLNNGDGTFDYADDFSVQNRQALLAGDLNGDQWPDLYAVNFWHENNLYINQDEEGLVPYGEDITTNDLSMGSLMFDFDEDGDLDIYITYDGNEPNELLINDGTGTFTEESSDWNLDNRSNGMGVDIADFDLDGNYDFYIANLGSNDLLIRKEDGTYHEMASEAGVADAGMGWGTVCLDYNNDGYTDIYTNNEFLDYPNQLYRNNGDMTFTDEAVGTSLANYMGGYGCATGDLNSDGKQDLVIVNNQGDLNLRVFINEEDSTGNWLQVNLVGTSSNKFALGARIRAYHQGVKFMQDIKAGSGYKSQNSYRVHLGFGDVSILDSLIIVWPDGSQQSHYSVGLNQRYLAVQKESLRIFDVEAYQEVLTIPNTLADPEDVTFVSDLNLSSVSVAHAWNELLLEAIRGDFARPTVHARNLFHVSLAMYDAWSAYDATAASILLGKSFGGYYVPFEGVDSPNNVQDAQEKALSYAAYQLIIHRFAASPSAHHIRNQAFKLMQTLGYDPEYSDEDYSTGNPGALGNYIAGSIIDFGMQDGSNEDGGYANLYYQVINEPLEPHEPGNPAISDPNRWQQLELIEFIDQSGNPISGIQDFLSPELGRVVPFALNEDDLTIHDRDGHEYYVYHDPGPPPYINPDDHETSREYKWNFELVSKWSAVLDASFDDMINISPASVGNLDNDDYPHTFEEYQQFYSFENADPGSGYTVNPVSGQPYPQQLVRMGDYARVLAEFWADGPDSETPPGHWFTILNYVTEHPLLERRFQGTGDVVDILEWDIKAYLALGGAMHDAAISAWGIKGYYDYIRPINALRYLADQGQSSDPDLASYNTAGIQLSQGLIELVNEGDPLAGDSGEHIGKIKVLAWKGPDYISDPANEVAGVDWILAENWWPYQRPSFVTPPFAGYVSGHSTYSRAAAEVLTLLTGSEYFPGGMGEFHAPKNEFLVFEDAPSTDITLQWAKYKDASDQCSLSRIWGGIHPPVDDIPGRLIGIEIGQAAFELANTYFTGQVLSTASTNVQRSPTVYPNPAPLHGSINIKSRETATLKVLNMQGQLIHEQQIDQGINEIVFPKAEKGLFLFEFTFSHGRSVHKVLVN